MLDAQEVGELQAGRHTVSPAVPRPSSLERPLEKVINLGIQVGWKVSNKECEHVLWGI